MIIIVMSDRYIDGDGDDDDENDVQQIYRWMMMMSNRYIDVEDDYQQIYMFRWWCPNSG